MTEEKPEQQDSIKAPDKKVGALEQERQTASAALDGLARDAGLSGQDTPLFAAASTDTAFTARVGSADQAQEEKGLLSSYASGLLRPLAKAKDLVVDGVKNLDVPALVYSMTPKAAIEGTGHLLSEATSKKFWVGLGEKTSDLKNKFVAGSAETRAEMIGEGTVYVGAGLLAGRYLLGKGGPKAVQGADDLSGAFARTTRAGDTLGDLGRSGLYSTDNAATNLFRRSPDLNLSPSSQIAGLGRNPLDAFAPSVTAGVVPLKGLKALELPGLKGLKDIDLPGIKSHADDVKRLPVEPKVHADPAKIRQVPEGTIQKIPDELPGDGPKIQRPEPQPGKVPERVAPAQDALPDHTLKPDQKLKRTDQPDGQTARREGRPDELPDTKRQPNELDSGQQRQPDKGHKKDEKREEPLSDRDRQAIQSSPKPLVDELQTPRRIAPKIDGDDLPTSPRVAPRLEPDDLTTTFRNQRRFEPEALQAPGLRAFPEKLDEIAPAVRSPKLQDNIADFQQRMRDFEQAPSITSYNALRDSSRALLREAPTDLPKVELRQLQAANQVSLEASRQTVLNNAVVNSVSNLDNLISTIESKLPAGGALRNQAEDIIATIKAQRDAYMSAGRLAGQERALGALSTATRNLEGVLASSQTAFKAIDDQLGRVLSSHKDLVAANTLVRTADTTVGQILDKALYSSLPNRTVFAAALATLAAEPVARYMDSSNVQAESIVDKNVKSDFRVVQPEIKARSIVQDFVQAVDEPRLKETNQRISINAPEERFDPELLSTYSNNPYGVDVDYHFSPVSAAESIVIGRQQPQILATRTSFRPTKTEQERPVHQSFDWTKTRFQADNSGRAADLPYLHNSSIGEARRSGTSVRIGTNFDEQSRLALAGKHHMAFVVAPLSLGRSSFGSTYQPGSEAAERIQADRMASAIGTGGQNATSISSFSTSSNLALVAALPIQSSGNRDEEQGHNSLASTV